MDQETWAIVSTGIVTAIAVATSNRALGRRIDRLSGFRRRERDGKGRGGAHSLPLPRS